MSVDTMKRIDIVGLINGRIKLINGISFAVCENSLMGGGKSLKYTYSLAPTPLRWGLPFLKLSFSKTLSSIHSLWISSGDNNRQRLSVVGFVMLWLYLNLPVRPLGLPPVFGQIEEWTVAAVWLSITGFLCFASLFGKKRCTLRITVCDILLLLYLIYILLRSGKLLSVQENILSLYTLTWLYVFLRTSGNSLFRFVIPILLFSLLYQTCDALLRHDNLLSLLPKLTGIYHNTGIWGGFIGVCCVGALGLRLFSFGNKFLLSFLFVGSAILLLCSQSRAAWIGALAGIAVLFLFRLKKRHGSKIIRPIIIVVLCSVPVLFYAGAMLYRLKPASAEGRLYIWQIASQMVAEKPFFGTGIDRFKAQYMYYQAGFLSKHPDSPFAQIADEVNVPFNEPLKIAIEQGMVGLAIALSILFAALMPVLKGTGSNRQLLYTAILTTLLVFSCFSYPFMYIQFYFLLLVCLTVLSQSSYCFELRFNCVKAKLLLLIPFLLITGYVSFMGMQYAVSLKKLHRQQNFLILNESEAALSAITQLEPVLKSNPLLLHLQAHLLFVNKDYEKAIDKLTASLSRHASYYTLLELGRNYEASGKIQNALDAWQLASAMIPNRFEPHYLQIGVFHRTGQLAQADSLTNLFYRKERKVDAIQIDRMMIEVRKWERERMRD